MAKLKTKHPMAGQAVKVEEGPHKGQYFKVLDYLVNQFQGKDIEKLAVSRAQLVTPVVGRGYPLDDDIVFGQIYPSMQHICVHDKELKVKTAQPPLKVVEDPDLHAHGNEVNEKENQDDSGTTDTGDNSTTGTGESGGTEGRTVSSPKLSLKDGGKSKGKGQKA